MFQKIGGYFLACLRHRFGTIDVGPVASHRAWLILELLTPTQSARIWVTPVVGHPLEYELCCRNVSALLIHFPPKVELELALWVFSRTYSLGQTARVAYHPAYLLPLVQRS
jgi:hypothetical protein